MPNLSTISSMNLLEVFRNMVGAKVSDRIKAAVVTGIIHLL